MTHSFILSDYIESALRLAEYVRLEDGTYSATIRKCPGVLAFSGSRGDCETQMRSTLEDWILVGLKLGHPLPVIDGIDLNGEPAGEPMDAV